MCYSYSINNRFVKIVCLSPDKALLVAVRGGIPGLNYLEMQKLYFTGKITFAPIMRYFLFLLLGVAVLQGCKNEQTENTDAGKEETSLEEKIYRKAIERNDATTMLYAINAILAKDSTRTELLDTLLELYAGLGNPVGSALVAEDLLVKRPKDEKLLMVAAQAYQSVQEFGKAAYYYERLLEVNPDYEIQYQLGVIYVYMGDEKNMLKHLNNIVSNSKEADKFTVEQQQPSRPDGKTQHVKLSAAALFSIGYYYDEKGEDSKAIEYYRKALQVDKYYDNPAKRILDIKRGK